MKIYLFVQIFQCSNNSSTNTNQYYFIDIINIRFPNGRFFINFNCIINFSNKFMYSLSIFFHILSFCRKHSKMNLLEIIRWKWFILSFNHRFVNCFQTTFHFFNGVFHFLHNIKSRIYNIFANIYEFLNLIWFPFDFN